MATRTRKEGVYHTYHREWLPVFLSSYEQLAPVDVMMLRLVCRDFSLTVPQAALGQYCARSMWAFLRARLGDTGVQKLLSNKKLQRGFIIAGGFALAIMRGVGYGDSDVDVWYTMPRDSPPLRHEDRLKYGPFFLEKMTGYLCNQVTVQLLGMKLPHETSGPSRDSVQMLLADFDMDVCQVAFLIRPPVNSAALAPSGMCEAAMRVSAAPLAMRVSAATWAPTAVATRRVGWTSVSAPANYTTKFVPLDAPAPKDGRYVEPRFVPTLSDIGVRQASRMLRYSRRGFTFSFPEIHEAWARILRQEEPYWSQVQNGAGDIPDSVYDLFRWAYKPAPELPVEIYTPMLPGGF